MPRRLPDRRSSCCQTSFPATSSPPPRLHRRGIRREACALALADNIIDGCAAPRRCRRGHRLRLSRPSSIASRTRNATASPSSTRRAKCLPSLDERPARPKSDWAAIGLYFYDSRVTEFARHLAPSPRGELEIVDRNRIYLEPGAPFAEWLGRG